MNTFKNIALLVCGLVAGLALMKLFSSGRTDTASTPVSPQKVKALVQQTESKERMIQVRIDSINHASSGLSREIQSLEGLLQKAKTKNRELFAVANELVKNKTINKDSSAPLPECDSLKTTVVQLTAHTLQKDSLYDLVIEKQEQQILKKDSTIQLHQQQYSSLKSSFNESISQQQLLLEQNKLFQKQIRRQRVKNKLLSGLTIIAVSITTRYLLK